MELQYRRYGNTELHSAATRITINLNELNSYLRKTMYNRLKIFRTDASFYDMTRTLQKRYKGYQCKLYKIQNMVFVLIHAQRYKTNLCFSQDTCNYTSEGREKIHRGLKAINKSVLSSIMKSFIPNRSIEYNDNRISKFVAQYGKCAISGMELGKNDWHCHHKNPYHLSKDDTFSNLVILHESVHRLVQLKDNEKIKVIIKVLNLAKKQMEKLNELRLQCHNQAI